jgi:hypothetical protein
MAESCARAIFVGGLVAPVAVVAREALRAADRWSMAAGLAALGFLVTLPVVWYGLTREDRASLAHTVRQLLSSRAGAGWSAARASLPEGQAGPTGPGA